MVLSPFLVLLKQSEEVYTHFRSEPRQYVMTKCAFFSQSKPPLM